MRRDFVVKTAALSTRLATTADVGAIALIYNQGIADRSATFETEPRTLEEVTALIRERQPRHPVVVAQRGEQVIAVAWSSPYRSRACYSGIADFSIYVLRKVRGSGAGRAVLARLIRECEDRGFSKLASRVFPENVASRRLCASLGFREVGTYRRHAKLDGRWMDCVIVEKLLGEAGLP